MNVDSKMYYHSQVNVVGDEYDSGSITTVDVVVFVGCMPALLESCLLMLR